MAAIRRVFPTPRKWIVRVAVSIVCASFATLLAALANGRTTGEVFYYSTAAPPADYPGPEPSKGDDTPATGDTTPATAPARPVAKAEAPPTRVASSVADVPPPRLARPKPEMKVETAALPDPIAEAKSTIASCAQTYAGVSDYTCVFFKRERIEGKLTSVHSMHMKARTKPQSIYFKFVRPNAGREAIYVAGAHSGKAVVHDVGIGKLLAGTLKLDPRSSTAMEDNRHPITEAGLGHMIETIQTAWDRELKAGESRVVMHPSMRVGGRPCSMIESVHPTKQPGFMFHMVKVYIDKEHNLPIRFEAYDWPRNGRPAELVEEYTYSDLRLNVGLTARDFDPNNAAYSFGRF